MKRRMKLMESAPFLLIATGTLLGLILPLGKIAAQAGIPPEMWTFLFSASAGVILFAVLCLRKKRLGFSGGRLRYYICTALISYALPNFLILSAIPHLGAGFTGIMYTLSPVITLLLSMGFGLRRPNALGIGGIAIGFVGAAMVAMTAGGGRQADRSPVDCSSTSDPRSFGYREYLSHAGLAEKLRADRACGGQPPGFGIHPFYLHHSLHRAFSAGKLCACTLCSTCAIPGCGRHVRAVLPAAGGGWAGLSQPDRLCRGGARPCFRHIVSGRALSAADLDWRGCDRGWRGHDHARAERIIGSGGAFCQNHVVHVHVA